MVVVTVGMTSEDALLKQLEGAVPVTVVGDAKRVGNAQDAIADAFLTAREL
jgi:hypothetical protein